MSGSLSVYDLRSRKGTRTWLQIHVDTAAEAAAAWEAGIEIISCEPDHHLEGIRAAAPGAFVSVGMPTARSPAPRRRYGSASP